MTSTTCDLLLDRLEENATKNPSKKAITFLSSGSNGASVEKQLLYSDLQQQTTNLAHHLVQSGLQPGDKAVLVYPPSHDYMISFLACLKIGVVAVPVFPPNPARRDTLIMFSNICQGCGAKFSLTSASYQYMKKLAGIKDAFSRFGKSSATTIAAWPDGLEWIVTNNNDNKQKTATSTKLTFQPKPSDLAFLQYTSGSTSAPKGVMITHGNLAHNLSIITNELKATDDTIVVSWLPQYHDMGLIGSYLGVLYCGGSGYYMSPLSFLQRPMLWIEAIAKYKATHLQAPNFAFQLTARKFNPSDYNNAKQSTTPLDLSSVRHVINAAEPVTEDSINAFVKAFGPFGFNSNVMFPTYGLAEHTVFVCSGGKQRLSVSKEGLEVRGVVELMEGSDDETVSRLVGCGYPAHQGVDVKIVERETCNSLEEDQVGEIWIQSPSKAAGYYNKPEETKEDFEAKLSSGGPEEYLRTGDLGFLHKSELFICGRIKDLIIVGGRNYYPQDLEATAEASSESLRPGCSAAFTIDPTRQDGEEVAMVLELREVPASKDLKNVCGPIIDVIRGAVNQEHSLGIAEIVLLRPKTVPKTTSGKIARAWCRKGYLANTLDVVYKKTFRNGQVKAPLEIEQTSPNRPLAESDVEKLRAMSRKEILAKLTADVAKVGSVPRDAISSDVALATILDSLSLSQFKGQLESEYAVKISDEYLFRESTTLSKLVEVVKLGYAPDDNGGGENGEAPPTAMVQTGQGGLAEALGCPPGVVCCVIQ